MGTYIKFGQISNQFLNLRVTIFDVLTFQIRKEMSLFKFSCITILSQLCNNVFQFIYFDIENVFVFIPRENGIHKPRE